MRFFAWIFLILTVVAVIFDWRAIVEDGEFVLRPLGFLWNEIHSASLQQLQPAIERHVSPTLWESVVQPILTSPAAIVFGIAFLFFHILGAVFRRPRQYYNDEPL